MENNNNFIHPGGFSPNKTMMTVAFPASHPQQFRFCH
jgi:hypothetical protein